MTSEIIDTTINAWKSGRIVKNVAISGWTTANAPCCQHFGHNPDTKGRGGLRFEDSTIIYKCFNCDFKTGYTVGGIFGVKFRKLLEWLNVPADVISKLKLVAIRDKDVEISHITLSENLVVVEKSLPPDAIPLDESHSDCIAYLQDRCIDPFDYPYYVSNEFYNRVIVPFTYGSYLVGYTARSIIGSTPKYINQISMPYVFGMSLQRQEWSWVPVMEGIFDALAIDGCAMMGNTVSDAQAEQLENIGKEIVVVPDNDLAGDGLIDAAIEHGWSVSFTEWPNYIKDVNDAVICWGKLYTLRDIWKHKVDSKTAIKIRKKFRKIRNNLSN